MGMLQHLWFDGTGVTNGDALERVPRTASSSMSVWWKRWQPLLPTKDMTRTNNKNTETFETHLLTVKTWLACVENWEKKTTVGSRWEKAWQAAWLIHWEHGSSSENNECKIVSSYIPRVCDFSFEFYFWVLWVCLYYVNDTNRSDFWSRKTETTFQVL